MKQTGRRNDESKQNSCGNANDHKAELVSERLPGELFEIEIPIVHVRFAGQASHLPKNPVPESGTGETIIGIGQRS